MKKILLGAVLASSFAMSGDLYKCSQALDKYENQNKMAIEIVSTIFEMKMNLEEVDEKFKTVSSEASDEKKKLKEKYTKLIKHKTKGHNGHKELASLWLIEAKKECKDILSDKVFKDFFQSLEENAY